MSDPVKNVEIEDVLTSIRRLVSENARGSAQEPASRVQDEPSKPSHRESDRLVLTPALRVEEAEIEDAEVISESSPAADVSEQEIPAPEDTDGENSGPRILTLSPELPSFLQTPATETEEAVEVDAHISAAQEDTVQHSEDDVSLETEQTPSWHSVRSTPAATDDQSDPEPVIQEQASDTQDAELDMFSADVEADAHFDDVPPDPPFYPNDANEMTSADDPVESETVAHSGDQPAFEAVIDEDMLRDLVGEIVRQELQGPLGERITRNVRKLVRREINRALVAHRME